MEKNKLCSICPRRCNANREKGEGFCHSPTLSAARAALHYGEEPPISGSRGSGTIFFSGCNLRCVFCQNSEISSDGTGRPITIQRLCEIMLELQSNGAHNINLVTPTHYADKIAIALEQVKPRLTIPVVYNCGGYESVESLKKLDGLVDIYLPDFKYANSAIAKEYSMAEDYPKTALLAIKEMYRQAPKPVFDDAGIMQKGLIVRHMVLPGCRHDSMKVLDILAEHFPAENIRLSLLRQYVPCYKAKNIKALSRRVTTFEYDSVTEHAAKLGFIGYTQQKSSASTDMIPKWDYTGL